MAETGGDDAEERITRLHEVATDLQAATDVEDVYDIVIDAAVEILGFDWCSVSVPDEGYFELHTVSEAAPLEEGERELRLDEGIAGRTFQENETVILENWEDDDEAQPIRESFTSGLSVPLGEWGIFQGASSEAGAFDEKDREAAELLASHATAALDRIDHERELTKKNERLEKFASVVSHDLRNPLNVAQLRLDLVNNECESEHIEDVERALERMEQLIDDLLLLARTDDELQDLEPVELASLAEVCWETLSSEEAILDVETDLRLYANESRLRQVLENLIKNSIEHGGSEITIGIGSLEDGFYVEDDGVGISPEERERVFESGYSTDDDGTGFGLSIVEEVVDAHGWNIAVTESADGGARFEITGVTVAE